jgi:hypothetical protein
MLNMGLKWQILSNVLYIGIKEKMKNKTFYLQKKKKKKKVVTCLYTSVVRPIILYASLV